MDYFFLITASIISLSGALFHGVIGQKKYMDAIYKSNLELLTKSLSFVAWHIFTIFLLVSAIILFCVAYNKTLILTVYPIIAVNFLGCIMFIALGLRGHRVLLRMPGAYLMGATALLAWLAI
jgi:hypothetical protein